MKKSTTLFLVSALALVTSACGSSNGGGGGTGGGGGGAGGSGGGGSTTIACSGSGTELNASEATNYNFKSKITCPAIKVKPMSELKFDWGSLTKSFLGHATDAKKDIKMISVVFFGLSLDEFQTKLNADALNPSDMEVSPPLTLRPDGSTTNVSLFSMTLNGTPVKTDQVLPYFDADFYVPNTDFTYAFMAADSTVVGSGVRMVQTFQIDKSSSNTDVKMTDTSTALEWEANLHSLTPMGVTAGQSAVKLDWSKMTKTASGGDFDTTAITRVLVAHYNETVAELEKKFLDIELIATDLYEGTIEVGTKMDFSLLKTTGGKAFPGIDDNGTWLVALQCGACRNPAPWYLSILKPCK